MPQYRITYIDYAKAICIFLMIVGHWTDNSTLFTYIYSFHMPALFVISGILFKQNLWYITVGCFFIPIIFFSLMNLSVQILIEEVELKNITFHSIFFGIFHYRYGLSNGLFVGDWFLWALIGLRFVFGDIKYFSKLRNFYCPLAILCVIYMTFEYYLINLDILFRGYLVGKMVPCMVFFCTGFYLKDHHWDPTSISNSNIILLTIIFIVMPLLNGRCDILDNNYGLSYILFVANALLSTILLFSICSKFPSNKFIKTISKGSLVVLGTHIPLLHSLNYIFSGKMSATYPIITIILCFFIITILEKHIPILLGRWR